MLRGVSFRQSRAPFLLFFFFGGLCGGSAHSPRPAASQADTPGPGCDRGVDCPLPETANMWRIGGDIGPNWGSVLRLIDINTGHGAGAAPGAWNDMVCLSTTCPPPLCLFLFLTRPFCSFGSLFAALGAASPGWLADCKRESNFVCMGNCNGLTGAAARMHRICLRSATV